MQNAMGFLSSPFSCCLVPCEALWALWEIVYFPMIGNTYCLRSTGRFQIRPNRHRHVAELKRNRWPPANCKRTHFVCHESTIAHTQPIDAMSMRAIQSRFIGGTIAARCTITTTTYLWMSRWKNIQLKCRSVPVIGSNWIATKIKELSCKWATILFVLLSALQTKRTNNFHCRLRDKWPAMRHCKFTKML